MNASDTWNVYGGALFSGAYMYVRTDVDDQYYFDVDGVRLASKPHRGRLLYRIRIMAKPISLVPKPTVAEEVRESVVRLLRSALEEAEKGDVDTVIIISSLTNGEWLERASDTNKISESIGRLEIVKQQWIAQFLGRRGNAG